MWVKEILSSHTGMLSCKRICGMLGWITCLIVALYATLYQLRIPAFLDTILITSATLLGLENITNIWKQKKTHKTTKADQEIS